MKDLADAFRLRNHVIRQLELADVEADQERRRALLTFVVAGGAPWAGGVKDNATPAGNRQSTRSG